MYGTCTMSIPAIDFNSSAPSWVGVPAPPDAKLSAPGFAFANAMSSLMLVTGTAGGTTTR